ncbi:hypothetical protein [Corallococcus terminator]|uniref:GNAT family N-acetyltransferase n=1 Tax=Corallococcus terminator TaxID=2316733 RepID=A0A3A8IK85_9BACT|nr:hypothetical protein [Corallococcus terminator]RKG80290.1 hypothetical protein D7V88_27715 [Corallococcus terminator]
MKPVPFDPKLHHGLLELWRKPWDETMTPDALPQTGFVVPDKAAGFLYRTDSSVALIEGIIAAPGLSKEVRNEAVNAIVAAIRDEARRLGFKLLLGYSQLDAIMERAKRFGFIHVGPGFHMVALDLTKPDP